MPGLRATSMGGTVDGKSQWCRPSMEACRISLRSCAAHGTYNSIHIAPPVLTPLTSLKHYGGVSRVPDCPCCPCSSWPAARESTPCHSRRRVARPGPRTNTQRRSCRSCPGRARRCGRRIAAPRRRNTSRIRCSRWPCRRTGCNYRSRTLSTLSQALRLEISLSDEAIVGIRMFLPAHAVS
jgi:hypothetical protein